MVFGVVLWLVFSNPLTPSLLLSQGNVYGSGETTGTGSVTGRSVSSGSWSDIPRRATISLGLIQKDQSGAERFATGGAGILIRDSNDQIYIATALHMFENKTENWAPEYLNVRGWKDENKSRYQDFGSKLLLRSEGKPLYIASLKFDLALIKVNEEIENRVADNKDQLYTLKVSDIGSDEDIFDGADVFILGFPGLIGDEFQQRAFMRFGIVAWTDSAGPAERNFLVDARIFPGNSGGPVFSSFNGITREGNVAYGRNFKLLGIVGQTINAKPDLVLGVHLPNNAMLIGAAGVGIISPAHELLDMMAKFK